MYLQQKSSSASQTEKIKTMLDDSSRKLFKSPKLNLKKNKTKQNKTKNKQLHLKR